MRKTQRVLMVIGALVIAALACNPFARPATPTAPETIAPALDIPLEMQPLPPRIIAQRPFAGEELPIDGSIDIYFDQPMNQASVEGSLTIDPATDVAFTWIDDTTLRITPEAPLARAERYAVHIQETARSADGTAFEEAVAFEIQTVGFLEVSEVAPAPDSVDVEADSAITVFFNRPVVPLGVRPDPATVPHPLQFEPDIPGEGEWLNTSIYIWHPRAPMLGGQRYTVTVEAGLEDQTGGMLAEDYSWEFTIASPVVVEVVPAADSLGVPLDAEIRVTFTQPMDHASTEAAFSITTAGQAVPGDITWEEDDHILIFESGGLLTTDATYTVTVAQEAQSAGGGAPLNRAYTWEFQTVPLPGILSTDPRNGAGGVPVYNGIRVTFTAPIDEATLTPDMLVVSPALPEDAETFFSTYNNALVTYAELEPSTTYTVTLQPGTADPYSNTIDEPYTFNFTTAQLDPMVQLNTPGTVGLYNAYFPTRLFVLYRNISRIDFSLYELELSAFASLSEDYGALSDYAPAASTLMRSWQVVSEGALNEATYAYVPITGEEGGALPPGVYLLVVDVPEIRGDTRHLMVVANANLTFKASSDEGLVWLTDLQSGEPITGIPVQFYDEDFSRLGQSTTNADGIAQAALPAREEWWEERFAVAQSGEVFAITEQNWTQGIDSWTFGVYATYFQEPFSIYLYTDRPLYRPGQEINFRGIVRAREGVAYELPSETRIPVTITNAEGDTIYDEQLSLNEFGAFDDTITLDAEAALGYYSIEVHLDDYYMSNGFQVAEYRKPEFQVTLTPERDEVLDGGTIRVTVDAEFFFGGPVSDAEVSWTVLSDSYFLDYTGPGRYSFYDYDQEALYLEEGYVPGYGRVIAEGTDTTDAQGNVILSIPARLEDSPGSRRFTIEATVTDIDGRSVAGRTEVIVHKGQVYPGIQPDRYIGQAGEEQTVSLIAVDWDSQPVPNQEITVTVVERRWYSVREEDEFGRVTWTWEYEDTQVGDPQAVITNSEGRTSASFTPPSGGIYKIQAAITDERGNTQTASTFMWVSGNEFISWRQANNNRIELIPDRTRYAPGDTAEILIASPFQGEVQALVTIEREGILDYELITLETNSYVYQLPITDDFAPNVYVSVIIVKGVDETNPTPAFRMGLVGLEVEPSAYELDLTVTPDQEVVGPREEVTYLIEARDREGNPVEAEVSLALVDLAVLTLSVPNSGPILDHFYGYQPLGVTTSMTLVYSVDQLTQELLDRGKGGGGGGAEGFFEIRGDFRDTAYWAADVHTDENGAAQVTVALPDNLTTWRMDARAVTRDTLVGQAEVDIVSTKPLLIRPVTPRFFVLGDEATIGAVVNNNTDEAIDATVTLQAQGVELLAESAQSVSIPAGGRIEVNWDVVVQNVDWVDMVFSVHGGGLSDASRPPLGNPDHDQQLPVYRYEVPETVGTAGQIAEAGQRTEGIVLPPTYEVTQGQLTIEVDPSLAAGMVDGLEWLEYFPYECVEQTVSRFLPNALTLRTYRELGLEDPVMESNLLRLISQGLQRLYTQQRVDGGWGWFITSRESNPTVTAYAILGIVAAQEAEVGIDEDVLEDGIRYLNNYLRREDPSREEEAFILYVLGRAGEPDVSRTVQLYDERASLPHFARAWLAQTLWMIDEEDSRVQELMNSLHNDAILSATGAHWEEETAYRWLWNTDTRSTAIILDTFALINPENALVPNIVRWLMVAREGGHWETTQETAWALIGLTDWLRATGELEADYGFVVNFNGETLVTGNATAETLREPTRLEIDVADLLSDEVNRLVIARDAGPGRLYYTAHLTAYLPVEEVGPLSRGIIVSREYLNEDGEPVTQAQVGDLLTVRLTIIAPHDLYYVVVEDPIPAGSEAVNVELLTESVTTEGPELGLAESECGEYWWMEWSCGWGWWWFSRTEMRDEKTVLFADYLPSGTYEYTYQIRALLPGEYRVIPPNAYEFYFPEVSGHGAGMLFTITEAD